jgi:hypothetical protein
LHDTPNHLIPKFLISIHIQIILLLHRCLFIIFFPNDNSPTENWIMNKCL